MRNNERDCPTIYFKSVIMAYPLVQVQYKFLYQAIREMIICDDTFIAVRDFNQVQNVVY